MCPLSICCSRGTPPVTCKSDLKLMNVGIVNDRDLLSILVGGVGFRLYRGTSLIKNNTPT